MNESISFITSFEEKSINSSIGALKPVVNVNRNSMYTTCVLCSVAVGTSLVANDLDEARQILSSRLFPTECDSLYIENEQTDVYTTTYRMFDSLQVLPRYIVRFASSSFVNQRSLRQGRSLTQQNQLQNLPYSNNSIIDPVLQKKIMNQIASIDELLNDVCTLQQTRELFTREIDWRLRCGAR